MTRTEMVGKIREMLPDATKIYGSVQFDWTPSGGERFSSFSISVYKNDPVNFTKPSEYSYCGYGACWHEAYMKLVAEIAGNRDDGKKTFDEADTRQG